MINNGLFSIQGSTEDWILILQVWYKTTTLRLLMDKTRQQAEM